MNGRPGMLSLQLSRHFSTTSGAASLSKRLRKQWRGPRSPASSPAAASAPAAKASNSSPSQAGPSTPTTSSDTNTSTSPHHRRTASQRKAALRALRHAPKPTSTTNNNNNNNNNNVSSLKFVQSSDKGKAKEHLAPSVSSSPADNANTKSTPAAAHSASMLKELNALDDLLDNLQTKAFNISQRLKTLDISRKSSSSSSPLEESWGPDRLSPPSSASTSEDTWSATPSGSTTPSKSDKRSSDDAAKTRYLFGNDLLAESHLHWRDGKGKPLPAIEYAGPFAEEHKKWSQSITGCVSANSVPVEKVTPLREMQVATLAHGLDRVLFNPGIYWLRDPRSGIYNFDPRIKDILDVDLFDYAALPPYVTSSQDPELATLTKKHEKKYCGSTSSMTSLLSQCYFLISGWRNPDVTGFSAAFAGLPGGFSVGAKLPASIRLHYKDGFYAIDADKTAAGEAENSNYVLTSLGKSMEKMLTATPEEYSKYMRINSWQLSEEEKTKPEAYHYASTSKMMMRSQLDCHDDRLPRKTFDLKTRASIGIRNDRANYVEGSGYQIRRATGVLESFEREYYDMVRAAFLKYNFQARIGHMDGIFVAYHTTSTIFGFQYIPVEEMNERLFGSQEMADQAFKLSLGMMETVLDAATAMFPRETLKITVETKEKSDVGMTVYVEPAEASQQDPSAESTKRSIAQLDITVDRYLDGGLMVGPVDFSHLPGRRIDPLSDDEIERRLRSSLPAVRWEIDYSISPRPDLTASTIRKNLDAVRAKQASLNSLILPNVEALNAREQYRTSQLASNPTALARFLQERQSGVAAGMPLAPGQLRADDNVAQTQDAHGKTCRRKQAESRFVRMRNLRTLRLRQLAQLGANDAKLAKIDDALQMYQPR
ncbi:related to PET127 - component of mitochondrial translation system [Ustilago trichophora]|uniref:Related to PET127 - component of mitochondrial translation system n=1 Tax=Ustilago trichophora TaxID=86804 RepID=A0A5C3EQ03_9BASI|nr:related to PET127 - component of mitochondrial translation system [Ustilago trichophora]